jgi:excisionase family DNA binding protein
MEKMYSINEICKDLGVARRTVHYWIATKQLKAFHLGGKRLTRIWERDLAKFLRRGSSQRTHELRGIRVPKKPGGGRVIKTGKNRSQ